jgi:hypothetical protein
MGKEVIFPPSKIYHFKKCYHSRHSIFKIIMLTIQINIGERSNTRQGEHALKSDHVQEQLNTFGTNTGLWKGQELGVVSVTHTRAHTHTHTHTHKNLECNVGLCATPCFQGVTPYCFSEDQLTLTWKRGALRHTYTHAAVVTTALILFSSTFLMK